MSENAELALKDIKDKIEEITTIKGDKDLLKNGIKTLQKALLENPSAVNLMLPEDIGAMVSLIRQYTGKEVIEDQAKKSVSRAKKLDLSPEAVDQLLNEEL